MKFISDPLKSFIKLETASSIILFLVSIFAIIWENSSYGYLYEEIWYKKFTIGFINSLLLTKRDIELWKQKTVVRTN